MCKMTHVEKCHTVNENVYTVHFTIDPHSPQSCKRARVESSLPRARARDSWKWVKIKTLLIITIIIMWLDCFDIVYTHARSLAGSRVCACCECIACDMMEIHVLFYHATSVTRNTTKYVFVSFSLLLRALLLYSVLATTNYTLFANKWDTDDGKKEKNEDSSWEIEYANDSAMAAARERRKKCHHQTK